MLTGDTGVRAVRVTIPAAQLDCGNGTMNEHMRKAIKLTDNPSIDFRLVGYEVARNAEGVTGTMTGTLSLGGVEKTITLREPGKEYIERVRLLSPKDLERMLITAGFQVVKLFGGYEGESWSETSPRTIMFATRE